MPADRSWEDAARATIAPRIIYPTVTVTLTFKEAKALADGTPGSALASAKEKLYAALDPR